MNETDAVSCLLCLQADEYGSMIKVCVPPGQIPPSSEKVICRRCAAIIADATRDDDGEEIGDVRSNSETAGRDGPTELADRPVANPDWDSGLAERAVESLVEVDRSEPEIATRSSKGRSPRRVASAKTDD